MPRIACPPCRQPPQSVKINWESHCKHHWYSAPAALLSIYAKNYAGILKSVKTDTPAESATKLAAGIKSGAQVQLAYVFKQSIHHYCLREWLALADDALAKNCSLSALPPPYMVNAISAQQIVGFCAGEPWNIQAQIQGYSWVIAGSKQIIPEVADKVLAVTQEWVKLYPEALTAIETAIQLAQHDLKTLSCLDQVWQMP